MLQCIDRTVNAWTFAVPDPEHAIDLRAREQPDLLAAPYRGRGEVLVQTRNECDIVRLQDAAGQSVIDFTEVESGILEGTRVNEGIYILQNLAAARSLAKSMDQMIGDWSMVRGNGQAICGLTLTNTEAGADNFQVFLKPKCDPAIAAFAPTQWRLEHGQMLLMSQSGETWQFEADDNAQWRRVPDAADPLIMLRQ